jgi:uncharacterized alkaline shock family protein YloU
MPSPDRPVEEAQEGAPDAQRSGAMIDVQALEALVRRAAASVYGVARVGGSSWRERLRRWLGRRSAGVHVTADEAVRVEIELSLLPGVPTAQVARNVEDAVRYLVQRDLGVAIDDLLVRVDGAVAPAR